MLSNKRKEKSSHGYLQKHNPRLLPHVGQRAGSDPRKWKDSICSWLYCREPEKVRSGDRRAWPAREINVAHRRNEAPPGSDISTTTIRCRLSIVDFALIAVAGFCPASTSGNRATEHPNSFISLDDADDLLSCQKDAIDGANRIATWSWRHLPLRQE